MGQNPEKEYWVVCPVCLKANPAGTRYCKYCWGAALSSQEAVPTEDLDRVIGIMKRRQWRRKVVRRVGFIGGAVVVSVLALFWILFKYSDTLVPVRQNVNSNSQSGQWAMFRHDFTNSGVVGATNVMPEGTVKWSFKAAASIQSSAAYANGVVYIGSQDGNLYALDAQTGVEKWRFPTTSFVDSSAAVVDGIVYFGSNDGHMYAVDAATGSEIWKYKTPYPVTSSPAVADGKVIFGADDYSIYALDAKKGNKIWSFRTMGPVSASPVVVDGLVYCGSGVQYAYALNATNGHPRLRFKMYDTSYGTPAIIDHTAYLGNYRGDLYAFDGTARNWPLEYELKPLWIQVWAFGLAPAPPAQSGFLWGLRLGKAVNTTAAMTPAGDRLFLGSGTTLASVDLVNRKIAWNFQTGGNVRSSPALLDKMVIFGSDDSKVYALDPTTGTKTWEFETDGPVNSSPIVVDGIVYVGSQNGTFYALE